MSPEPRYPGVYVEETSFRARSIQGVTTSAGSDWKYVPLRRFPVFIEESISQGTQWAVFEPNDERLWQALRATVTAFLQDLFANGALQGTAPEQAYFVKCGRDTMTQSDIDRGVVNIVVGFAPERPAEFEVVTVQQLTAASAGTDPYRAYPFRVRWAGRYVAGAARAPDARTGVTEPLARSEYDAVTLERGVTNDTEFADWATRAGAFRDVEEARRALAGDGADIDLESYDDQGQLRSTRTLQGCWVSEFRGMRDPEAAANVIAIMRMRIECSPLARRPLTRER